ncbi:MAG: exodeoxyribonuclease V subunit alpha [Sporichthyaceae bacterium]
MTSTAVREAFDPQRALRAPGLVAKFNDAGVLGAADVHVALTLGRLAEETDERVLLAAALVVRSTRSGSVVVDLTQAQSTTAAELAGESEAGQAPAALPWPPAEEWIAACAASPLVEGVDALGDRPLRMAGGNVWLDRYYRQEESVAADLLARLDGTPPTFDAERLAAGLARLFPKEEDADQRAAADAAVRSRLTVLAGGPGTGKTTTVARMLALLCDQQGPAPRIALAAPTGKAAARLTQAVRGAVATLDPADAARVGSPPATTVHRLLGFRPGSARFRHHRGNRLPHDVVVVDETSMVSLTLMAQLLEAVRPQARLILVGDPDQLASVEAGAVLGDLVSDEAPAAAPSRMRGAVVRLERNRRTDEEGPIAALARAARANDVASLLAAIDSASAGVEFVEVDDGAGWLPESVLAGLRAEIGRTGKRVLHAAEIGDGAAALEALDAHRVLCAHRNGPRGVRHWTDRVLAWLAEDGNRPIATYGTARAVGEPLLVTANSPDLGLFNGDTGVVIADPSAPSGMVVAFDTAEGLRTLPIGRLPEVRPIYATTVHRAQGSEFKRVTVVLPPAASPLCSRQTLYTALTRAVDSVRIIGSRDALRRAVEHPAARASGLAARLREPN